MQCFWLLRLVMLRCCGLDVERCRRGPMARYELLPITLCLGGALLLGACSPKPAEAWLVSTAFREPVVTPTAISETRRCDLDPRQEIDSASVSVSWPLGQRFRLAGYGVFPFWKIAPWVSADVQQEPGTDHLTGHLLVLRGRDRMQPSRGVWWVVASLDTIGVSTPLAERMRAEISRVVSGDLEPQAASPCVVASVVASHSHSGPDLTGLWGAAATAWDQAKNQRNWQTATEPAILEALAQDVARAKLKLAASRLSLGQADVSTSAAARLRGLSYPNVSLLRFAQRVDDVQDRGDDSSLQATAADKDPALLIWNGHPTTDPRDRSKPSGDYPATLARALAPEVDLSFLPGALAGQYPRVREDWMGELTDLVRDLAQAPSYPFGMQLAEVDYCVAFEARHASLFAAWSALWGVSFSSPCEVQNSRVSASGTTAANRLGFRATFQRVTFFSELPEGSARASSGLSFSLYLLPFEVFQDIEKLLGSGGHESSVGDIPFLGARAVSLANGFSGHALSKASWQALTSLNSAGAPLAKPYHALMSAVGAADPLIMDAVSKLREAP